MCYVETKNLDGETNLKHKLTEKHLALALAHTDTVSQIVDLLSGSIICEDSNDHIYKFEGTLYLEKLKKKVALNSENLCLRGSSLRNTEWVIGMVVYAGHQTKIMMNSSNAKFKMSNIEKETNRQIVYIFMVQIFMCFVAAICSTIWQIKI